MKERIFILCFFISICNAGLFSQTFSQIQNDSVTISGRVTDYNGHPIDSASVWWQRQDFSETVQTITNTDGYYRARIPKGKHNSMACINMNTYPHTVKTGIPEVDQRLEFWAWDFIADHDTVFNIRYHRMEVYGIRAFRIPGATPAYQVYVRPMSLTRYFAWKKNGQSKENRLAPPADKLKAVIWIDGEEVPLLMKQEIKEYFAPDEWGNAYLLTVNLPKQKTANPYRIFKVMLTDLENGDCGEGLYFMEKEHYYK